MAVATGLLSQEQMIGLLTVRKETATQDYKRDLPPRGHKTCSVLDLLKDLVAMANTGGGVIIFGVDDERYDLVGINVERQYKRLDEQDIRKAIATYVEAEVVFELAFFEYKGKEFAFLVVLGVQRPLLFRYTCRLRDMWR